MTDLPTNWKDMLTSTENMALGQPDPRELGDYSSYLLFQPKANRFPTGIPSISTSSPVMEEVRVPKRCRGVSHVFDEAHFADIPKGDVCEGRTTVVSQ